MTSVRRAFVLALFVLLGFEVTTRLDDWGRFDVPIAESASSLQDLLVRDAQGQHARPNAHFKYFHVNSRGFRGPDIDDAALHTTSLVVTSGASETFGLYESPGHEWPRQLSDTLDRMCGARRVTVLNAAFPGMAIPSVEQDVRLRLHELHPSVVVYYPTPWQYLRGRLPAADPPSDSRPDPINPWQSRALPRVRDAFKRVLPAAALEYLRTVDTRRRRAGGEEAFAAVPRERIDSMEADLRSLVGEVRRAGARLVLVLPEHRFTDTTATVERRWLRTWERQAPKAPGAILLTFHELARNAIRRVAADSGVVLAQADLQVSGSRAPLFADFSHFTDLGAGVLAGTAATTVAPLVGCKPAVNMAASTGS